jgi:hypothetical protein
MNDNTNNQQTTNANTPADNGGQGGKMFTQDEVNRIVSERLAREREKLTQQPKEDEREVALREREKAVAARENRFKCEDYLKEINLSDKYRSDFLEVLGTDDFEKFKSAVDRLGTGYIVQTVQTGAQTAFPPANDRVATDEKIRAAFKPKI